MAGRPTQPVVVAVADRCHLFLGPRDGNRIEYVGTDVYVSSDPLSWKIDDLAGHLRAPAPEVVRDVDGKWYVSDCGWGHRGLYIAPLIWSDGLQDPETNIAVPQP